MLIWDAVAHWPVATNPEWRVAPNGADVYAITFAPDYTTSLDTALTLVPDHWRWLLDKRPWGEQRQDGFRAEVYLPTQPYKNDRSDVPTQWGPTPALALCIAALKAQAANE